MLRHLKYLRVVLTHKLYVYRAGVRLGVPRCRLIIHDASKFSRAEWTPYVNRFISGRGGTEDKDADTAAFKLAWRHHWQNNPHHWEYWRSTSDDPAPGRGWPVGPSINGSLEMPETYVREMVADWIAASKAYTGSEDIRPWYEKTKDRQVMHPRTRSLVEELIREEYDGI